FGSPDLGMPFAEWKARMEKQRPVVDRAARAALEARLVLDCKTDGKAPMPRGKPLPVGPTARLPGGVKTWEEYAALAPEEMRKRGAFPYQPLDHPLPSTDR